MERIVSRPSNDLYRLNYDRIFGSKVEPSGIGDIVKLKVPLLGNPTGALGVCYETYNIGHNGKSYIFENGEYDGFSEEEENEFLKVVGHFPLQYSFSNVMTLSRDFENGVFNEALNIKGE